MDNQNFTFSFMVDQTPREAFDAINNVRGWWTGLYSEEIEGSTEKLDDEFTFRAGGGVHYSKHKLIEVIPDKKVVWLVTDSKLTFVKDQSEWSGTKIIFDISKQGDKTQVCFTHVGLVPDFECYNDCSNVWGNYLQNRLMNLITIGD
ncbi:MAG TPA: SRPBCC domain-containing protein [Cytophagales bacterium]|nr:SRPBCC domain-containing protein [Cytophagales bacterium]